MSQYPLPLIDRLTDGDFCQQRPEACAVLELWKGAFADTLKKTAERIESNIFLVRDPAWSIAQLFVGQPDQTPKVAIPELLLGVGLAFLPIHRRHISANQVHIVDSFAPKLYS